MMVDGEWNIHHGKRVKVKASCMIIEVVCITTVSALTEAEAD